VYNIKVLEWEKPLHCNIYILYDMVSYNVWYGKKRDWKIIYCKNDDKTQIVKHILKRIF